MDQDAHILNLTSASDVKRRRPRRENAAEKKRTINYCLRKSNGDMVPLCAKTFLSITCVGKKRLYNIVRHFSLTGRTRLENRGGSRQTNRAVEISNSIQDWISGYKGRVSHYGRGKSERVYLPPELNVVRMWRHWKKDRASKNCSISSLSKFKKHFYRDFNIGFGNPRSDVCSYCETKKNLIRQTTSPITKVQEHTQYRLHKQRAKKFYSIMGENDDGTVKICFDMQQNQPLPKLSVGEVFYSRQIWLYNLTFVRHDTVAQSRENVSIYMKPLLVLRVLRIL